MLISETWYYTPFVKIISIPNGVIAGCSNDFLPEILDAVLNSLLLLCYGNLLELLEAWLYGDTHHQVS